MTSYEPHYHRIWNPLDEIGGRYGMPRLPLETLGAYRQRLLLEARDHAGPTQGQFIRSVNRQVGLQEMPVLQIDLMLDDDEPVAVDPFVEVTSSRLRAYSDYENLTLDIEIDLYDQDDGLLLSDIFTAFSASIYFSMTAIDPDYADRLSRNLRFGNSTAYREAALLLESRENKLANSLIKTIYPERSPLFKTEVFVLTDVDETGKYYINYTDGVVYTYDPAFGSISYSYRQFPYVLWWQPVKVWPLNDEDSKFILNDTIISDETGDESWELVGSKQAAITNQLQQVHPLTWGF